MWKTLFAFAVSRSFLVFLREGLFFSIGFRWKNGREKRGRNASERIRASLSKKRACGKGRIGEILWKSPFFTKKNQEKTVPFFLFPQVSHHASSTKLRQRKSIPFRPFSTEEKRVFQRFYTGFPHLLKTMWKTEKNFKKTVENCEI